MTSPNEEYIKKNRVILIDNDENTRLHYACALNNEEEVEKILATGHKLDPENYLGWTPLMMAIRNCNFIITKLLLKHGANSTKTNKFGINVFLICTTCGDISILETLLEHLLIGGVSRSQLQKVLSPISLAIMFNHDHIVEYLLSRSFDINATTQLTGLSPLMFASAIPNNKILKILNEHKASHSVKNCVGSTAMDMYNRRPKKTYPKKPMPPTQPLPMVFVSSPQTFENPLVYGNYAQSAALGTPIFYSNVTPLGKSPQMFFGSNFQPQYVVTPEYNYNAY